MVDLGRHGLMKKFGDCATKEILQYTHIFKHITYSKGNHPLCPCCKKTSYLKKKCWFKPKFSAGHANNWGIWRGCVKTNNKKNTKLKQWINTRRSNFLLHHHPRPHSNQWTKDYISPSLSIGPSEMSVS